MPLISERRVSLAMRAAGASLPVLIFSPVERRSKRVARSVLFRLSLPIACREAMFVLMRLIVSSVIPKRPRSLLNEPATDIRIRRYGHWVVGWSSDPVAADHLAG